MIMAKIKSPRRKAIKSRKSSPKRKSVKTGSHKAKPLYQAGNNTFLNIEYNGIGHEFVFALTNKNGKIGSQFVVKSDLLLQTMINPLMVNPI
jgi:hypothetical protein